MTPRRAPPPAVSIDPVAAYGMRPPEAGDCTIRLIDDDLVLELAAWTDDDPQQRVVQIRMRSEGLLFHQVVHCPLVALVGFHRDVMGLQQGRGQVAALRTELAGDDLLRIRRQSPDLAPIVALDGLSHATDVRLRLRDRALATTALEDLTDWLGALIRLPPQIDVGR